MAKGYEDAVRTLNLIQPNAAAVQKIYAEKDRLQPLNIPEVVKICERVGITLDDLDKLSVIHVSGTKGKGSTCALTESILRHHGYKTGFYSSPHLIEVRERIRINGRPLSKERFATYFWEVYDRLENRDDEDRRWATYSRIMTVMAFHVFLREKVDVVILEVGMGGEYDSTNIIRKPVVCGIASLGLDHLTMLGVTIAKIAWHKAGILKPGVPGVTLEQPENGLDVIAERAKARQCPIYLTPPLEAYDWGGREPVVGISGDVQHWNASLALQLCKIWLADHGKVYEERRHLVAKEGDMKGEDIPEGEVFTVTEPMAEGLKNCRWPGRTQTIQGDRVTYYLDGAHTQRSIQHCAQWFIQAADEETKRLKGKVARVLVFNVTGERKPEALLVHLVKCNFDAAVFCPNVAFPSQNIADQFNVLSTKESAKTRCEQNRDVWLKLRQESNGKPEQRTTQESKETCASGPEQNFTEHLHSVEVFPSVKDSFDWILKCLETGDCPRNAPEGASHIQVLVTGSVHFVGSALRVLDPGMNDRE